MDVVHVMTVARRALTVFGLAPLALVFAPIGLSACGDSPPKEAAPEGPIGRLEFNLVGQGSQGTLFRLRDAVVTVQGPDQTLFFDSEDEPDSTSFSAMVPAGFYSSFLQEGWRLERADTGKAVVDAALLSPNPDTFEVFEGSRTQVALRFRAGPDVVVTDPGLLEIVLEVEEAAASTLCTSDAQCPASQECCLAGFAGRCTTLEPGASCPLPDLTVSADVARASLFINQESFPADSCAIEEGCVVAPGLRRLLRFSTMTPNIGESDLILGDPTAATGFEFAPCHNHFHFNGYARYELVNGIGEVVAVGHKQAFCLLDSMPVLPDAPPFQFHCGFQGLTRGWADIYDSSLDCQWVDITDVPDGDYLLRISINPDQVIDESNYDNNTVEVPVSIAPQGPVDPLAECALPSAGPLRECGWAFAPGFKEAECVPGQLVTVGCGCNATASCGGDPMIRVCEGSEACGSQSSLGFVDDTCGFCPQLEFTCPTSGIYSVLTGSYGSGDPFSCDLKSPI